MSKVNVTRKWLNQNYKCFSVGYCGIQTLLRNHSPQYYTCGVYGWNFDAYIFDTSKGEICLTTGYRGMIDNFPNNHTYALDKEYENKAQKIAYNHEKRLPYEEEKRLLDELLKEYLEKVIGE